MAIIGGADGPTAIFISGDFKILVFLFAALVIAGVCILLRRKR